MKDLISILLSIKHYSKDIHYSAKGDNFLSDHDLADKIGDGLDDFIDQINEKMFLGYEQPAIASKEILKNAIDFIPPVSTDIRVMWQNLYSLLVKTIDIINSIEGEYDDAPITALMDSIADDIQAKRGLLWRRKLSI